jgi:hypothetical protein
VLTVTGLPPDTPAEVEARLVALDGTDGAHVVALAAEGGHGRDARTTRVGRVTARDDVPAPAALLLPASAGGLPLPLERELADEFARRERRVPREWLAGPTAASPAETRTEASHPAASWTLALGLGLLLAAGLAASRGQGVPGIVR